MNFLKVVSIVGALALGFVLQREFYPAQYDINQSLTGIVTIHVLKKDPTGDSIIDTIFSDELKKNSLDKLIKPVFSFSSVLGTGFFNNKDGEIISNYHVVGNASEIMVVLRNGDELPATFVGGDKDLDVGVIKISEQDNKTHQNDYTVLPRTTKVTVGEVVFAVGGPFGLSESVTKGIISFTNRINEGVESPYNSYIQTDASINHGNSGGPLINSQGEVVGINTMISSPNGGSVGIGFAIPDVVIERVVPIFSNGGEFKIHKLGLKLFYIGDDFTRILMGVKEKKGIYVEKVQETGLTANILKHGDIIVSFDGANVSSISDVTRTLFLKNVGDVVEITFFHEGEIHKEKIIIK